MIPGSRLDFTRAVVLFVVSSPSVEGRRPRDMLMRRVVALRKERKTTHSRHLIEGPGHITQRTPASRLKRKLFVKPIT